MRINELLIENNQIDEISLGGIGRGIGNVARGAATAVGGLAGGAVGAGQAMARGYKAGKAYVGGTPNQTQPASTGTATPGPAGTTAPDTTATPQAQAAAPTTNGQQAIATPQATAQPAATAPTGMRAAEIVNGLKGTWEKARASQDSQTSSPAVKAQIIAIAKDAGMTGERIPESKRAEFKSSFLGMTI
jgi:hypothetical protein